MAEYDFIKMQKKLAKYLDEDRYEHTLGVMFTCAALAMVHDCDLITAQTAGLLHDCAKCIPNDEKLRLCEENDILISSVERENPFLLHAKLGALLAKTEYDVTDPLILHAIKVHTTGEPDMNILDMIIYIADYIEPNRNKAANLDRVRELAFHDLDVCMAEILHDTLVYLKKRGGNIDPTTQMTYEFYKHYKETI